MSEVNTSQTENLVSTVPEVPESFMSMDDGPEIQATQEKFFNETLTYLGYEGRARDHFCEIRPRMLVDPISHTDSISGNVSPDWVTELVIYERTVAVVARIRGAYNFTQALFANFLDPKLEAHVRWQGETPNSS